MNRFQLMALAFEALADWEKSAKDGQITIGELLDLVRGSLEQMEVQDEYIEMSWEDAKHIAAAGDRIMTELASVLKDNRVTIDELLQCLEVAFASSGLDRKVLFRVD